MQGQSGISTRVFWSAEDDEYLRQHYHGVSARLIGEAIGKTRMAVIGRASRLKINKTRREMREYIALQHKVEKANQIRSKTRKDRADDGNRARFFQKPRKVSNCDEVVNGDSIKLNGVGVKLWDVAPQHCRWVIGEPSELTFCGHNKVHGSSYCAGHQAIVKQTD